MPLPDSGPLSLQVNSSAVQSRPKRAMIVRMSAETLDALEAFPNNPPMYFDFGDVPGICIGDTFFPMRPQKESSPHELYLRAASAAKPMAPLKLYANVIGKFMVERQLGEKVTGKVRQQTLVAKQQHLERQAILLDRPLIHASGAKNAKRKLPGSGTMIKKATSASEQLRVPSSSAAPPRKVSPLPQNTPSSKASADVRRRLVHCLAITPRLSEEAVKLVGGANIADSARDDLLILLEDVAEQQPPIKKGDKSPRPWSLKLQTWTEVRPFEWPKLTESERVNMARQARMSFKSLKIPESDPAWDNVRYRPAASTIPTPVPPPPSITASTSTRSSTSTQPELKRSAISSKDAKLKSKQDASRAKGEIQVKDESSKPTIARVNAIKREEADRPSDSATGTKTVASRRLPGSGYQAKKSPQPSTGVAEKSGNPVDARTAPKPPPPASLPPKPMAAPSAGTHARKTIPTMPPKPMKKEDESDRERDKEYERQREREREKRAREKEKQREEWEREQERAEVEKREKMRQKEREAVEREKRKREKEREREREREEMEQEKRQREKERTSKEKTAVAVSAFKRKTMTQDVEDMLDDAFSKSPLPKRRRLDDASPVASSSKIRDVGLPRKPVHDPSPVPRLKMKKDSSPQAPIPQERRVAGGSTHKPERLSKASGSTKPRRRSPIYTSSEDEGEISPPRKRNPSPPPASDRSISSEQPPAEKAPRPHRVTRMAYPSPTDHAALRALYQSQYSNYLGAFSKVVAQKRKIEAILNGDSEGEVDVMDPDDLIKLSDEHKSLKTELEHIHEIYTKGTTGGGGD